MSTNVKISDQSVKYAREQSKIHHRTIGGQIDYWVNVGRLAENHPGLTYQHLLKVMQTNQLADNQVDQRFKAISLDTKDYRFSRDEANDR